MKICAYTLAVLSRDIRSKPPAGVIALKFRLSPGLRKQLIRQMKLITVLLIMALVQAGATGYSQQVTLREKNASVEAVFHAIEKQTGYVFFYDHADLQHQKISINLKNVTLEEALDRCFAKLPLTYKIIGTTIAIKRKEGVTPNKDQPGTSSLKIVSPTTSPASAPLSFLQREMTTLPKPVVQRIVGKVNDENGEPLPGVSILIKGTQQGTTTDGEGRFQIEVSNENAVLVFSFVGYVSQEVVVGSRSSLEITMQSDQKLLDELVVVGYGTQSKEKLTGAIATIRGQDLENRPTASPANLLQGLAPGLTISKSGQGDYPSATSTVKVRNFATWKGGDNQPLYVINGFIRDKAAFDNINPNDIASISILKDAASASIYGMKAGNGVILVTTKSGSTSQTTISYNVNYSINNPTRLPRLMNAYEDATLLNSIYRVWGYPENHPSFFAPDELEHFKTNTYSPFDDAWKQPWSTNHNLSISGGGEKIRYFVSGSFLRQGGGLNQQYDKSTLAAKLEGDIAKDLSFTLNVDGTFGNNHRPNFPFGTDQNMSYFWYYMYYALPWKPTFINGLPVAGGPGDPSNGMVFVRKEYMRNNYRIDQNNLFNTIFNLQYEISQVKGLAIRATAAINKGQGYHKYFNAADRVYFFKLAGTNNHIVTNELDTSNPGGVSALNNIVAGAYGAPQYLQTGYNQTFGYQLDFMVTYQNSFGKHDINAFVAFEPAESRSNYLTGVGLYYNNLNFQEINGAGTSAEHRTASGTSNYHGQQSYFGRVDYNYDQKYLFGVTFRADGSMKFAPHRRWGYFPAVSVGWNVAKEKFFENLTPIVENFKVRATYGLTGTDNVEAWQWQQNYNYNTSSGTILGSGVPPSISLGTYANPDVTWERNYDYNFGIDVGTKNGLISVTADYWYRKTKDILDVRIASTPVTVGARLPAVNYGEASAQGFEFSISHDNNVGKLHYHVGGNWAVSSNKYLIKDQAASVRDYQNQIGRPIDGWIMGYQAEGIIRDQEDVNRILDEKGEDFTIFGYKPMPGMLMYKDIRGPLGTDTPDGKVDVNDQTPLSFNGSPRISYGVDFSLSWKGIQLSTIFSGFGRYDVMLPSGFTGVRAVGIYQNNLKIWEDSWRPDNTQASLPHAGYGDQGVFQPSTFWMRKGDYLRLKNVMISYALPNRLLSNSVFNEVKAYFSGENLFLWDHIKIYDPELGGVLAYPLMKTFTFGLSVSL